MDAIALLRELAPLARDFGWPAVFLALLAPQLIAIARAHVRLIDALRETLPAFCRNQRLQTRALHALTALHERSRDRKDRGSSPLASLIP